MHNKTIAQLLAQYPFVADFFAQNRLDVVGHEGQTFATYLAGLSEQEIEDKAIDRTAMQGALFDFIEQMTAFLGLGAQDAVRALTILPGHNKLGQPETFAPLTIESGQIVSIVGPTGAGKSRLLADIEWAAQADTPTGRSIRINGEVPDLKWRYSPNNKLVAQLSQNMNFVMDLTVHEFITLHAESRMLPDTDEVAARILQAANQLAGEQFALDTPVTGLSGGQSRALMIADTAILSASPIVLIDEIENAGIDRAQALKLLVAQDKIVLMATHDPMLALMADRRIIIQNGGIYAVLTTTEQEKALLHELTRMDEVVQSARAALRAGHTLSSTLLQGR